MYDRLLKHLGAFFTPYTMLMFILGLWLGYLGAVEQFRTCWDESLSHGVAASQCPIWVFGGD